jgi:hypothetical protein
MSLTPIFMSVILLPPAMLVGSGMLVAEEAVQNGGHLAVVLHHSDLIISQGAYAWHLRLKGPYHKKSKNQISQMFI